MVCRGVLVCVIRDATEKAEYQGKRRARGYAVNGGEFEYRRHLSSFRRQRRRPSSFPCENSRCCENAYALGLVFRVFS